MVRQTYDRKDRPTKQTDIQTDYISVVVFVLENQQGNKEFCNYVITINEIISN